MAIPEYTKRLPEVRVSVEMAEALDRVKGKKSEYIRKAIARALKKDSLLTAKQA
jgi:hypothetical protein